MGKCVNDCKSLINSINHGIEQYNIKLNPYLDVSADTIALVAYLVKIFFSDNSKVTPPLSNFIANVTTNNIVIVQFDIDETLDWIFLLLNVVSLIPEKWVDRDSTARIVLNLIACLLFLIASGINLGLVHNQDTSHQFHDSYYLSPIIYLIGSLILLSTSISKFCAVPKGSDDKCHASYSIVSESFILAVNISNLLLGTVYRNSLQMNMKCLAGLFAAKGVVSLSKICPRDHSSISEDLTAQLNPHNAEMAVPITSRLC